MKNIVFFALALLLFTDCVFAEEIQAPFGFKWGQSKKDIMSSGVILSDCKNNNGLNNCRASNPLSPVSFGDIYFVVIDDDHGLQKVLMVGKDIDSDITGANGKELYENVKSTLIKKYGKPNSYEYSGRELYDEYDEFYQCLMYDGCGDWVSFWSPAEGGAVSVQLKGLKRGTGYIQLTYESKMWKSITELAKKRVNSKDSSAL